MQEILYFYDGSFEGFLSCVFESYAKHEHPTAIDSDEAPTFFASRWVETDNAHAQRVLRKLHALSPGDWSWYAEAFSPASLRGRWHSTALSANCWRKAPPSSITSPMKHCIRSFRPSGT